MIGRDILFVVLSYSTATTGWVLFHFGFIHTNILFESDSTLAYVSISLFFLVPLAGMINLALLIFRRQQVRRMLTVSMVAGFVGPLLIVLTATNPGVSFAPIPIVYFAFVLAAFFFLLIAVPVMLRPKDPDAMPCTHCGYDLRGARDASPRICSECGSPQEK